jgi:hypothetical protein
MSGDPADKSEPRLPSWRPPADNTSATPAAPASVAPGTEEIDDAWASGESPNSSERAKPPSELPRPVSERRPVSEPPKLASLAPPKPSSQRPSVTSRPPTVRVSSTPTPGPAAAMTRRATLLGIAPAPDGSSESPQSAPPASSPGAAASPDGASKFEAAAQLLEQKRASMAPKAPTADDSGASSERTSKPAADGADAAALPEAAPAGESTDASTPPPAEVAPESGKARRSEPGDTAPKSRRRRSSAPPAPRGIGIIPLVIAAAVFVVMFLVGAMRAMRDELVDSKPSAKSPPSVVESPPPELPVSAASLPAAPAATIAPQEPAAPETAAPAPSIAEPVTSASAEPASADGTNKVLVRSAVAGAKFFRNGKQVGMNSVIVELAPGEKRAFEVNLPGYVSRKVVVDGSRAEVVVYLPRISDTPSDQARPASAPATGAPQADPAP